LHEQTIQWTKQWIDQQLVRSMDDIVYFCNFDFTSGEAGTLLDCLCKNFTEQMPFLSFKQQRKIIEGL